MSVEHLQQKRVNSPNSFTKNPIIISAKVVSCKYISSFNCSWVWRWWWFVN